MATAYRTAPDQTDRMPAGIPYIVGNEAAERFSFYGMKAILAVFMTEHLLDRSGNLAVMSPEDAKFYLHSFVVAGYLFPLVGAILADWLFGKYRTILWLSIIYCLGHLSLALDETRLGLGLGLGLIAIGTGAIKPCVSAHVGDQFGAGNRHLLSRVFGWFYLAINLGALASTLLTPILLDPASFQRVFGGSADSLARLGIHPGPGLAFGVPGVLMALATLVFWMGRNTFIHVPPRGRVFLREAFSGEGLQALASLVPIYLCVAAFWCLFDQTASAWVLQAKSMDMQLFRSLSWLPTGLREIELLPSQLQAVNPLFILIFVPLFSYLIYPAIDRVFPLTPLRKIGIGMFLTVPAFSISGLIQVWIDAGGTPSIGWQVLAYALLTAAEVMVSITCLEFSYTQSPPSIKSIVMSLYLASVAVGNEFTAVINALLSLKPVDRWLSGANYYWFFTGVMLLAALIFIRVAVTYRGRTYAPQAD
jgi:POT family proton-dependent oligopeptide transporter